MTTFREVDLNCPCCGNRFESSTWGSTNTLGQETTDLYQYARGYQPLPLYIHTCDRCGYTGYRDDFQETEISEKVKELIKEKLTPLAMDEEAFPGQRYECAAWIAEWREIPSLAIGNLYLRAAYCCCVYDENREDESRYRRQAIKHFENAIQKKEVPEDQIAAYTYLIGELYRRVGERENAGVWFDQVPELVGQDPEKEWLVKAANQQKTDPKEFFDRFE
jgi:uncharacterized protein (DUF2225 family)